MRTQSPSLTRANELRASGRCVTCGTAQVPERIGMWRCKACQNKFWHSPKKWHEHDGPETLPTHAGMVKCLRCDVRFKSPDKRLQRQCPKCHAEVIRLMDGLGCEEAIYVA